MRKIPDRASLAEAGVCPTPKRQGSEAGGSIRCCPRVWPSHGGDSGALLVEHRFRTNRLTVSRALQRQKARGLVLVETKNDRARRAIGLRSPLVATLKAHRLRQLKERLAAGSRWVETGLVFVSCVGTALESHLFRAFKATLRKTGLANIRFHDLRHSAASLMLAQGVPLHVVMEVLGTVLSA